MADKPFQRLTYKDSMARFGSDKPDLRNPLEIADVSSVFEGCGFKVFNQVVAGGGSVQAIAVPLEEAPSRKYFDDAISWFKKEAKQGLAWMIAEDGVFRGSIAKFFEETELNKLRDYINVSSGNHAICLLYTSPSPRD